MTRDEAYELACEVADLRYSCTLQFTSRPGRGYVRAVEDEPEFCSVHVSHLGQLTSLKVSALTRIAEARGLELHLLPTGDLRFVELAGDAAAHAAHGQVTR